MEILEKAKVDGKGGLTLGGRWGRFFGFSKIMSKQYKKVIKRRRRKAYLARQKVRAREATKTRK